MEDITLITAQDFLSRYVLTLDDAKLIGTDRSGGTTWTLTFGSDGDTYESPWSQGSAYNGPPDVAQVVECFALDGRVLENCRDIGDLMDEFGYERVGEARTVWDSLIRQRDGLTALLGPDGYACLLTVSDDIDN